MPEPRAIPDEPPPFLGTWRRVYGAVLGYLALVIAAAWLFTRTYR
jgi:flagellar biogenesis protein FliO